MIICTTPLEEDHFVKLGADPASCCLYPGGVDEEAFKSSQRGDLSVFLRKHSIPEDRKLITFVGTIEERKNPLAVVKVARTCRNLQNAHFVIAGSPSSQDIPVRAESKGLSNLTYLGRLSERDKISFIRASYVNILLSRMEALGLTQLEFMYSGVPVITSAVGGQKWLIRDGVDGIHVNGPDDFEGAARAVRRLVSDEELRNRLSKNASKRAKAFTLRRITATLSSRLETILESQSDLDRTEP